MTSTIHSNVSNPVLNTDEGASTDKRQAIAATLSQEAISRRAYQIYLQRGRIDNQCQANWLQAQQELIDEALDAELQSGVIAPEPHTS